MLIMPLAVARAGDLPTKTEALALAFPGATTERTEVFLSPEQVKQVQALARVEVRSKLVVVYTAKKAGARLGVALFDTHTVRTAPETAMVAISPEGKVLRVEVVQFNEPAEYTAPARWVSQFDGKQLGEGLSLKADIKPLSGASLTAQSLVDATRRALALFDVLHLAGDAK
jgi:Na+-translocating ferredoxin:NAD+ oxidoreductase RnfG subunit